MLLLINNVCKRVFSDACWLAQECLAGASRAQSMYHGLLISELEDAVRRSSQENRLKALRRITILLSYAVAIFSTGKGKAVDAALVDDG
jgi:hypothetical protein